MNPMADKPDILQKRECQRQPGENKRNIAAIKNYYDSLTQADRDEKLAWGEFAESQFPVTDLAT
jgi:hypothetical protein